MADADRKAKKMAKKANRRSTQLARVNAKAEAEAAYFWAEKRKVDSGARDTSRVLSEAELFGKQGTAGINFKNYDNLTVDRSGPGSSKPALLQFSLLSSKLPAFLSRNISLMRYEQPTPIQANAVPLALDGHDLMCCAQTGSGKTAAFLIPVISSLCNTKQKRGGGSQGACPRALVLSPTRELTMQIHLEAQKLSYRSPLRAIVVYGGASIRAQLTQLAHGCDVCVATPGRLSDFVQRGVVSLSAVEFLVLDEADRMLDMGFEPQIRQLVQRCDMPARHLRHTLMFSATFPPAIQKLAGEFLREQYEWVAVGRVGSTTSSITQSLVQARHDKREKLELVLEALARVDGRTLVFVQKKRTATWVKKQLVNTHGIVAEDIHGDRSQSQRESALAKFREGAVRVLVATDVAARGLDIPAVSHVINMDLPCSKDDFDSYVHRIGRTGRAGHEGFATSLFVPGFEPKAGNGSIAPALLQLLQEARQEVPQWLRASVSGGRGGGGGGRGGRGKEPQADVRGGVPTVRVAHNPNPNANANANANANNKRSQAQQPQHEAKQKKSKGGNVEQGRNPISVLSDLAQAREKTTANLKYDFTPIEGGGGFSCSCSWQGLGVTAVGKPAASKKEAKANAAAAMLQRVQGGGGGGGRGGEGGGGGGGAGSKKSRGGRGRRGKKQGTGQQERPSTT